MLSLDNLQAAIAALDESISRLESSKDYIKKYEYEDAVNKLKEIEAEIRRSFVFGDHDRSQVSTINFAIPVQRPFKMIRKAD